MKSLSPALQVHLDDGTTTLSWCWRIARADGVTLGFTDHDRVLTFDGTDFEPESGFAASEVRSGSDLSVDAQDAEGVLTSDRITETDIIDGRWDAAEVELWRVNWADTSQRVLLRRGAVGQIRRGRMAFVAEVRSLAHVLVSPRPAVFILSGGIAFLALGGAAGQDVKKARLMGESWKKWTSRTSFVPYARGWAWPGRTALIGGTLLWLLATWAHPLAGAPTAGIWLWLS